ncbi:glycosyltransferase [Streptomyces heliomycini]|uniref:Glycosyltransferase n=1 Tax=Streptomyces heliomycini TaxID=284032 RepID=A0ABV5L6D6_9ACTN|nr:MULTISPECIES: glycosyltransferase [Streptomyces]
MDDVDGAPAGNADAPLPRIAVVVADPDGDGERTVRALLAQTVRPVSVTVVTAASGPPGDGPAPWDDGARSSRTAGSPDDAGAPAVRVVRCAHEELGPACVDAARNAGAPYVAVLRGGDEALPHCLEHLSRAARDGGGDGGAPVGLVQCGTLGLRDDGLVDGFTLPSTAAGPPPSPRDLLDGAYLVRRALLDAERSMAAWVALPMLLVRRRTGTAGNPAVALAPGMRVVRRTRLVRRGHRAPAAAPRDKSTPRLVSVVVPVRDGARTLAAQLTALSRQTGAVPYEVLVVDNGSTDATREVAERARAGLRNLRIVDASDRPGESRARNRGIAAARGDFVAFCDADDVADSGWLAAMTEAAKGADLVGGGLDTSVLSPAHTDEQPLPMDAQTDFLPFARGANCGAWKDVLTAMGGWDERYRGGGEDMDLSWRAQLCGYLVRYAGDAVMHYRLREDLTALARQKWNYGRSGAQLYAAYRRAGFRRREGRVVVMNWCWLVLHVPDLVRSPAPRRRYVRYGARLAGFLAGSVRRGVRYL